MRIALVTHKFSKGDGQGRVNLEVARAAVRRGWMVTLVATEPPQLEASANLQWLPIRVGWCPTALLRYQLFALVSWLRLTARRSQLDAIVVNGFITWARADFNAAHYVHSAWLNSPYRQRPSHWSLRELYQRLFTRLNARLEKLAFARSSVVIAVSQTVKSQLLALGMAEARIRVIPNGVDTREFHPGTAELLAAGTVKETIAGIFVGQLKTPHKNLATVLRAMQRVPEVQLIVVGEVGQSTYPQLAMQLGVRERVHFLGYRRDVAALMRAADFFLCPSLHDSNPLVLLEGLASGLPVITARTVGGAELLSAACAFVLDDPENDEDMADAMRKLAASAALRTNMSAAARSEALALDFNTMAEQYCDLFATQQHSAGRPACAGSAGDASLSG